MATFIRDPEILARYTKALLDYATELEDVSPLETLRDDLFKAIQADGGKTLTIANPTGKTFEFQVTLTNEESFSCVQNAIKQFNEAAGDGPVTFIDFSRL